MKRRCLLSGSISDSFKSPSAKKAKEEERIDVSSSLEYLRSLFPGSVFKRDLPPIVLKHQLYSLHDDRTTVDRFIMSMRDSGELRMLKLGVEDEDYCLIIASHYSDHIQRCLEKGSLSVKVTGSLLQNCKDVSVSREQLTEHKFRDEDISSLVSSGVLLVRDVGGGGGSWWFGVPGVSPFVKSLTRGRGMLQQIIGRSKFKEMLHRDLLSRKMTVSKLPMEYHIHDLVGADIVERVQTTSGDLLRLLGAD